MRLTSAKFVRKYNVGQYESEEYSLEASLDEGDKGPVVLATLKADIEKAYKGEAAPAPAPEASDAKPDKKAPSKKKKEEEPVEEEAPEEVDDEALSEETVEDEEEAASDEPVEDEEEQQEEEPKGKGKTFKKKPQKYSRSSEQHKDIFSSMMKAINPDWKKSEQTKARAKVVSQKMEGKDFLNESGEVIPEFKAEVKKLMAAKK